VAAVKSAAHATDTACGKCVRRQRRAEHDDGQEDHCISQAGRLPQVFIVKLNSHCLSASSSSRIICVDRDHDVSPRFQVWYKQVSIGIITPLGSALSLH
jgi:hypothetical protein